MRCVSLIYNPSSGRQHARRAAEIAAAQAVLLEAGLAVNLVETRGPGTAGEQARAAVQAGSDTVFACGGDGTVHEVLQGLVGTSAALGVIPLGTANALAVDLGLPPKPDQAARQLLAFQPARISVGRIFYRQRDGEDNSRYFVVAAGIGMDARVMYNLSAQLKRRFGYSVYIAESLRVWATASYSLFEAASSLSGNGDRRTAQVSQLLAVRIANFGGVLRNLAPGAELRCDHLRLLLFRTQSRLRYLRFLAGVVFGWKPQVTEVELLDATTVECRAPALASAAAPVYVEADGEVLGTLPARIEMVHDALSLLMPPAR